MPEHQLQRVLVMADVARVKENQDGPRPPRPNILGAALEASRKVCSVLVLSGGASHPARLERECVLLRCVRYRNVDLHPRLFVDDAKIRPTVLPADDNAFFVEFRGSNSGLVCRVSVASRMEVRVGGE